MKGLISFMMLAFSNLSIASSDYQLEYYMKESIYLSRVNENEFISTKKELVERYQIKSYLSDSQFGNELKTIKDSSSTNEISLTLYDGGVIWYDNEIDNVIESESKIKRFLFVLDVLRIEIPKTNHSSLYNKFDTVRFKNILTKYPQYFRGSYYITKNYSPIVCLVNGEDYLVCERELRIKTK